MRTHFGTEFELTDAKLEPAPRRRRGSAVDRRRAENGQGLRTPQIRALAKQVKAAQDKLHSYMALARANGLVPDEDLRAYKRQLKRENPRDMRQVGQAEAAIVAAERYSETLIERLTEHGIPVPITEPLAQEGGTSRVIHAKSPVVAELPAEQLAIRTQKLKLVVAMDSGCSARQAILRCGGTPTPAERRTAQRLYKRYKQTGGVSDRREGHRGRPISVLTPEMQQLIAALANSAPTAHCGALRRGIERHLEHLESQVANGADISSELLGRAVAAGPVTIPSEESIRRALWRRGEDHRVYRNGGMKELRRQHQPNTRSLEPDNPNDEWQMDTAHLDIWVRRLVNSQWEARQPYLMAIIDVYSRAIMAIHVSTRDPDATGTGLTLYEALREHPASFIGITGRGTPTRLVMDNGAEFKSGQVADWCMALHIAPHYCVPHRPAERPHIERFFLTLQTSCLSILPGYKQGLDRGTPWTGARVDSLLTIEELRSALVEWCYEYNHATHSITESQPAVAWADAAPLGRGYTEADLQSLFLHRASRQVSKTMVLLSLNGIGHRYWSPALTARNGEQVTILYNPDDMLSVVALPADGTSALSLYDLDDSRSPYTPAVCRRAVQEHHAAFASEQKELLRRLPEYYNRSLAGDRLSRADQREEDSTSRGLMPEATDATSNSAPDANQPPSSPLGVDADVLNVLRMIRRPGKESE